MCVNCITHGEVVVMNAGGVWVAANAGWTRLPDRFVGRTPAQRRLETWDANAKFLASLGHSPDELLGPRPYETLPFEILPFETQSFETQSFETPPVFDEPISLHVG